MQFGNAKPPVGVLFDCDMGQQIDAALALALLYTLEIRTQARVVALSTSQNNLKSAALCDALRGFYMGRPLPVGMSVAGRPAPDTAIETGALVKPVYKHTIQKLNDTAEVAPNLRNALTAQHDGNAVVVLAGPATNLVELLQLPGAKQIVAEKARALVVALGAYPNGGAADPRVTADLSAAKQLFAEWPTPIIAAGAEVGQGVPYPVASLDKDFAYAQDHLIVDAYRASKSGDTPTGALAAALYAVKPDGDYFQMSAPGRISVGQDGRTSFAAAADGKHHYLIVDPAQKERLAKTYVELVSAQPKARPSFRPKA